jgi:hypothetical protein
MTNTERIQANNADLRECIELAENLPNAGGGGESTPTQEKTIDITENGTVEVIPDEGYALSKVTANVVVPIPEEYIVPRWPDASPLMMCRRDGVKLSGQHSTSKQFNKIAN